MYLKIFAFPLVDSVVVDDVVVVVVVDIVVAVVGVVAQFVKQTKSRSLSSIISSDEEALNYQKKTILLLACLSTIS